MSNGGALGGLKQINCINQTTDTGYVPASMSKIQGLFKDFSRTSKSLSNSFHGLNVNEKY